MKKILYLILILVIFTVILPVGLFAFELQKTIEFGSDEDRNYIFFKAGPIVANEKGEIFVADSERCVIRKYDGTGKFMKEVGEKGQGPLAFMGIAGMVVWRDSLLIYDRINKRLSQYNFDLEHIQSERLLHVFSGQMACSRDYLLCNRWENLKGGIMMVRPFKGQEKLIVPDHDFGKYAKHRSSPLFYAYFCHVLSVNPKTGGFLAALKCPLTGQPEFHFYNREGVFQRMVRMEEIREYEFDERFIDLAQMRQTSRKDWSAMNLSRVFFVHSHKAIIEYGYQGDLSKPDTAVSGLLLVNTQSGKIMGRLNSSEYDIRYIHKGLAYGYIRDAEDAELKVGVYRIVLGERRPAEKKSGT